MKFKISSVINRALSHAHLQIRRVDSGLWDRDPEFLRLYKKVQDRTCVKIERSYMIYQYANTCARLPHGNVAQVGVYRGGTSRIVAECFNTSKKKMYLFDTFEGLPPLSKEDGSRATQINEKKDFADVDFEEVKAYFSDLQYVELRKGFFPDTARGLEQDQFCFAYLDTDIYQSIKDGLDFFYPRMVDGGVIMFDDYGTNLWPGVERAVREFCAKNNIVPIKTAWWQGLIIKAGK